MSRAESIVYNNTISAGLDSDDRELDEETKS